MIYFISFIIALLLVALVFGGDDENVQKAKKDLLVNKDFEDELIKKISNPKYRQQILELIKDDLQYIYGDAWKELYGGVWGTAEPYAAAFASVENIVLFLMLSKSGLVPDCYHFRGIEISNFKNANAYECLKILHCVEKNIQQKRGSSDYQFIFNPEISYNTKSKRSAQPRYEWPCSGTFHWKFERVYYNSAFVISDIHSAILIDNCKKKSIGARSEKEINNPYKDKLIL